AVQRAGVLRRRSRRDPETAGRARSARRRALRSDRARRDLRPLLAEFGLDAPSSHVSLLDAEDPGRVFAVAAGLVVGTVIQPYWDRRAWDREEDIRATAERLNALAPLASEAGLRVGYHNHEFEARPIFDGRCGLEVLVGRLDPRVVLELDY